MVRYSRVTYTTNAFYVFLLPKGLEQNNRVNRAIILNGSEISPSEDIGLP